MSEVSKFVVAFVLGLVVSVAAYKFLGVPHFLGAPGDWGRASYVAVRFEGPFAPVAQDPSYYGPALCGATVKIENRYSHAVSVSFYVRRKGQAIPTTPGQDSYGSSSGGSPPGGGGYGDNGSYDGNAGSNGSYDSQYGSQQNGGDYSQDNADPSDTPYGFDIRPDETVRQTVKIQTAQDNYGQGGSCDDLNRKGAVELQLVGCSVEGVTDPVDADCGRQLRTDF
ncbi:MAG TPA: hypothetical protein VFV07_01605 [Rhizomicrobium sp.]|nr:hypothetical protein [Rhizomicrobium sp.]